MLKKLLPILLLLGVVLLAVPLTVGAYSGGPQGDVGQGMGAAFGQRGGWKGGGVSLVEATAQATGLSEDEVLAALQDGKSFADIAADAGVTSQDIVNVIVAARKDALDTAVADGRISQEQADQMLTEMSDHLLDQLSQPWTAHGRLGAEGSSRQGRGRMGGGSRMGGGRGFGTGDPENCPYNSDL